jgi:hypothetical protein
MAYFKVLSKLRRTMILATWMTFELGTSQIKISALPLYKPTPFSVNGTVTLHCCKYAKEF